MWDIDEFCERLSMLVNIDSASRDTEGIYKVGNLVAGWIAAAGLEVKSYEGNSRIQGQSHESDTFDVMLAGHMDTVFPKGTAKKRPYREEGGRAYGPGVADMKGGLLLAIYVAEHLRKKRPDLKICLVFNSDEEIGSEASKQWIKEIAERTKYAFVFEPGRENNGFISSRKGGINAVLRFYGKASHAGAALEEGANAIVEMARWITKITSFQNLGSGTSINVGVVKGGTAANVVADFAEAELDIRVKTEEEIDRIKKKIESLRTDSNAVKNVKTEIIYSNLLAPMGPSDETLLLMEKMEKTAAEKNIEISWVATGGVSDANHIASIGVPTICGCGPCGGCLHSDEEYLELASVEERMELMFGLISQL